LQLDKANNFLGHLDSNPDCLAQKTMAILLSGNAPAQGRRSSVGAGGFAAVARQVQWTGRLAQWLAPPHRIS
jgi:hypothetical protein